MKASPRPLALALAGALCLLPLARGSDGSASATAKAAGGEPLPFPLVARFENFGERDGIPSHKVHCVLKAGDGQLWVGTANGLCVRGPDGRFRSAGPEGGLSHAVVLGLAEDRRTGDLWIATMQGLARLSGGKFKVFTQTDSGLPNNVVYAVAVVDGTVWAATPAGAGAYDTRTKSWRIYDQNNAEMEEPWCYAIAPGEGVIYLGIWAGGIVEHDPRTGSFKAYRDPDGDFQFQLTPDSGPIADITSWVAYDDGILWQGTYFGLARYDTRRAIWRTWVQDKTPLVSNFINSIYARGRVAWVATDRGASVTDGTTWANYTVGEHGGGLLRIWRAGQAAQARPMDTSLADGFVLGIWADESEAWFATSNGLSHAVYSGATASPQP